jgi:hypothetical protein
MANTIQEKTAAAPGVSRRFFSEADLAAYAGLSVRTLQGWRMRGLGPPFKKLCGSVRYDIEGFEAWVSACDGGGGRAA